MISEMYVDLPVRDLKRSVEFFTKVGFSFNPQLTDENSTCMILGENMYAMLLAEPFFKKFIPNEMTDTARSTETIVSLAVENRDAVDALVDHALSAGGKMTQPPIDVEGMYNRSFRDLDGHCWEVFTMDLSKMKPA